MKLLSEDYLMHHGIAGQKWGQRNGPPYPLAPNKHSASEKKAGWQKSLKGSGSSGTEIKKGRTLSPIAFVDTLIDVDLIASGVLSTSPTAPVGMVIGAMSVGKKIAAELKYKKVHDAIKKNTNIDEETGLKRKSPSDPNSPEADLSKVNPGYGGFMDGSTKNCMLCTAAYDLRRRGYDVMAGDASEGKSVNAMSHWYKDPKIETTETKSAKRQEYVDYLKKVETSGEADSFKDYGKAIAKVRGDREYRKQMAHDAIEGMTSQGDGARGNVMLTYAFGGGHSMIYEVRNGKTILRDAQINKTYTPEQSEKYLRKTVSVVYCRTDNLEINPDAIKEVIRE